MIEDKKVTITLQRSEITALVYYLGCLAGKMMKDKEQLSDEFKFLTDKILIQSGGDPYWHYERDLNQTFKEYHDKKMRG